MSRSDLLISLVKASSTGDRQGVQRTVESIIAEERKKQHNVLADRLQRAMSMNGHNISALHRQTAAAPEREALLELTPERQLNDLVLPDVVLDSCRQLVEEQHRAELLRAHGLDPRHRILLVGPPGNGKTTLAEALAEALAVPLFVVRYEAMIGSYLGETAERLKRLFDYVRTTPCVLFFDEFDAIGKERGDAQETGEIKRVVTALLVQIDRLPSYAVVVAATNHAELLDRAVWRRFQLRLSLPAPDQTALKRYFERFLQSWNERAGVSAERIVKTLGAVSYAEAEEFCLDVRRQHVLALNTASLKQSLESQLAIWQARGTVSGAVAGRMDDA